ncbi:hypothetical protein PF005_g19826, partial [Phytophthora fragariae]
TEDDRARHEGYFAWPDLRICTAAKQYDQRQYDLANLLPTEGFSSDANLKGPAGLLYDKCASFGQARRTFACIVSAKCGDQFDLPEAMKAFGCGAGNETSLTEAQVHAIAGEANPDAFREWRAEQAKQEAGEQAKQETEAKQQRKDRRKAAASEDEPKSWVKQCEAESKQRKGKKMTQKELKAALFKVLLDELERLPKGLIRKDNQYVVNTIAKQRKWSSPEQLAYAIKSVYGYVTADNVPVYVKKSVTTVPFSGSEPVRTLSYSLSKAYDSADVIPHSPMEPCDLGSVFNMFGQYQHKYEPSFVINQRLVDMWVNHVKDVICSGDARLYEYLLNWFAHILQHPGVKTQTVPLLKSKPGAGKNFLVNVFARQDHGHDRRGHRRIQPQGQPDHEEQDLRGQAATRTQSSIVEAHDRRYICIEVSDKVCPGMPGTKEYWDRVYKPLLTMEAGASIFHWLLRRDITKFNIRNLPETNYKKLLKCRQSNVGVRFLLNKRQQLIDADTDFEQLYTNKDIYAEYVRWTEESNQKLVNDSTFLQMLDSDGFPLKQKRIKGSDSKPRRRVLTPRNIHGHAKALQAGARVDYIKYRLMQIGGHDRAFRYIVSDLRYKGATGLCTSGRCQCGRLAQCRRLCATVTNNILII